VQGDGKACNSNLAKITLPDGTITGIKDETEERENEALVTWLDSKVFPGRQCQRQIIRQTLPRQDRVRRGKSSRIEFCHDRAS